MSQIAKQKQFMETFGMSAPTTPILDEMAAVFWARLIEEEFTEFSEAFDEFSDKPTDEALQANLAAEIVDTLYVLMGFAHSQGLPLEEMFDEVHNANMRKVLPDGTIVRNHHGKVLKPVNWYPANKVAIVRRAHLKAGTYGR